MKLYTVKNGLKFLHIFTQWEGFLFLTWKIKVQVIARAWGKRVADPDRPVGKLLPPMHYDFFLHQIHRKELIQQAWLVHLV